MLLEMNRERDRKIDMTMAEEVKYAAIKLGVISLFFIERHEELLAHGRSISAHAVSQVLLLVL